MRTSDFHFRSPHADIIKKTAANRDAIQALDARFKQLTDSIVKPLKGKQDSQVPAELMDSLERLAEYVYCINCYDYLYLTTATEDYGDSAKIPASLSQE
jgi:hypothetical protein